MSITAENTLTFDKVCNIFPEAITLVDGLLFAPFPQSALECTLLNEDVMIVAFVKSGTVNCKLNGTSYEAETGDVIIANPGDITEGFFPKELCIGYLFVCSVNITIELVRDLDFYRLLHTLRSNHVVKLPKESSDNIFSIISVIERIIKRNTDKGLAYLSCFHLAEAITCELYDGITAITGVPEIPISRPEAIYRNFIELLTKSPIRERDVKWYADRLCISSKYLSKVCNVCSGRSASDWIREYVMYDIRSYLKNSSMSIKEVANRLGFSSLTFFGKSVRRWFGVSPSELRAQLRKQQK
ncbi:MAG: helix-turn-helix domain-containing protein [Paramuribaculum sp.]|nr:helix-turn-helix domain-containing protein [Paramuribaculum sp.]